ncbi:crossover junction endodeoxyribonuclease RuvC [Breznakiella homolactica]|uniref:crossover junction endodeoxyribonuclease RuvC n=1 Tax=Breznakiella homolactica TaxID=2798577 RepID=UPI0032DEEC9D
MCIPTRDSPKDSKLNKTAVSPGLRRIIGIDPGLASTGWGIIEFGNSRMRYIAHGCIETKADCPRAERLFLIYKDITGVISQYEPREGAVETLYFARNVSSAIPVAEARGVLCMALAEHGLPVREFTPNAIKQAVVGRGAADKAQVQEMVRLILGLETIPKPDHAADALGAAVCSAHTLLL